MATLKISDLSVGDWIEIDHEDFGWQPAQINVCGDLGIGAYFKDIDPEEEYDCTLSQGRPIPITAEILEKNGWEFCRDSLWLTTQIDAYTRANVWLGNNGECRVEVSCMTKELDYYFCFADVKLPNAHIHLLQRVLRLAGVEKEINL